MIELYINKKIVELEENAKVSLEYQLTNLAEIQNKKVNKTSSITIPFTSNNLDIFDYSHIPDTGSEILYNYLPVKLFMYGVEIIKNGTIIIDEITEDGFECNIYWGIYDLYAILKENKLSDLNLYKYDDTWTPTSKLKYITASTAVCYPLIDWHKDSPNGAMLETGYLINSNFLYPTFYASTLFTEILIQNGFSYEIKFDNQTDFEKLLIPLTTRKSDDNLNNNCEIEAYAEFAGEQRFSLKDEDLYQLQAPTTITDKFGLYSTAFFYPLYSYAIPADGVYSFEASIYGWAEQYVNPGDYIDLSIQSSKGSSTIVIPDTTQGIAEQYTVKLENLKFNKGDFVYFCLTARMEGSGESLFFNQNGNGENYFKCTKAELQQTEPNLDYPVAENLPDLSEADYVKFIMQRYGLFCYNIEKHIIFFSLNEIYKNRAKATNIDSKIISENKLFKNKKAYVEGFSRKNKWSYTKDIIENYGYINCSNNTIDAEKNIYNSQFTEATDVIRLSGVSMANFGRLEVSAGTTTSYWKNEIKNKIVSSYDLNKKLTWWETGNSSLIYQIKVGIFDGDEYTCDWQKTLDNNYSVLKNILINPQTVQVKVNWNIEDFLNINPEVPYFFWNSYWILNQVKEFVAGELTELEFIKI